MKTAVLKKALFTGAFLFLSFLAAAGAAAEVTEIRHVIDGDTVILRNRQHVRLIGINAPELGKDGAPDQPLAVRGRDRLAQLVRGQRVTLAFERERQDHYGRLLAHVLLPDGRDVGEILLREGLAWAVAVPPNVDQLDILLKAENEARAAGRGVWGEPVYAPKPANDLTANDTGFRFIEGTVLRRTQGRNVIYFDLAPRVALVVPRKDWKKYFGGDASRLVGHRVIARGWLAEKRDRDVAVAEPRTPSKGRL
ncbi:MAG: thermonuclease family protein, partial [Gammaproteobacteria bacterium]|nr:thermonuclease family protein [Gammaproteobacteria bacterium]